MNIKEVNGRLTNQPYVAGFTPSNEDAKLFAEMFGNNATVVQWAAQMASYYNSERQAIVNPPKAAAAAPKKAAAAPAKKADDDDDMDLFGEETEEEAAAKEAKKAADKAAADAKKAAKKAVIAKSSILMDIKPWDAEYDLEDLAKQLKSIEKDGLLWGAHKLVPVAFGVKKLQIIMVIEDDKISGEDIEDMITGDFEEYVQSMDIVAWNKI